MNKAEEKKIREAVQRLEVKLPDGRTVPRLGQGTWRMGEVESRREEEIESLRLGIRLGMTLIDTAEMYGSGGAEKLVGEAIKGVSREELFLVSKVYPHNAGEKDIFKSCKDSIGRMGVEQLDLYLLHWRGSVPLHEIVKGMEKLKEDGFIKGWGVSNFDKGDMKELFHIPDGENCQTNQVLYHLGSRGIEYDLLPWMEKKHLPFMAYSPLAQAGRLKEGILGGRAVEEVCRRHGARSGQVLLAFALRFPGAIVIPKAGRPEHVLDNAAAAQISLTDDDVKLLESEYPAPQGKVSLDIS
jgi:diketogulonate reductase-like aldo/keto reductase